MNKFKALILAAIMVVSMVFIDGAVSSNGGSFAGHAQTVTVKHRRHNGIASRTYRGGRYVVRKTWNGTKYVSRKVWVGTKWTGKKTWKTGRKVVSRIKKVVR